MSKNLQIFTSQKLTFLYSINTHVRITLHTALIFRFPFFFANAASLFFFFIFPNNETIRTAHKLTFLIEFLTMKLFINSYTLEIQMLNATKSLTLKLKTNYIQFKRLELRI